jgi:hypothetical protein
MVRSSMGLICLLAMISLASAARATDFVLSEGILSDAEFYQLVSCGAAPRGACRDQPIKWPADKRQNLTIGIAQRDAGFPSRTARFVLLGLRNAVRQLNRIGADVRLNEVTAGSAADILIYLQDIPEGGRIEGTGLRGLDGVAIEIGRFHVLWDRNREITRAGIVLSRDLNPRHAASVILEEIVQSLGLIWDIRNPAYRDRSIFDEDSNRVTALRGQDIIALRQHYPGGQR